MRKRTKLGLSIFGILCGGMMYASEAAKGNTAIKFKFGSLSSAEAFINASNTKKPSGVESVSAKPEARDGAYYVTYTCKSEYISDHFFVKYGGMLEQKNAESPERYTAFGLSNGGSAVAFEEKPGRNIYNGKYHADRRWFGGNCYYHPEKAMKANEEVAVISNDLSVKVGIKELSDSFNHFGLLYGLKDFKNYDYVLRPHNVLSIKGKDLSDRHIVGKTSNFLLLDLFQPSAYMRIGMVHFDKNMFEFRGLKGSFSRIDDQWGIPISKKKLAEAARQIPLEYSLKFTFYKSSKLSDEIGYFTVLKTSDYRRGSVGGICRIALKDVVECPLNDGALYLKITELDPKPNPDDPKPNPDDPVDPVVPVDKESLVISNGTNFDVSILSTNEDHLLPPKDAFSREETSNHTYSITYKDPKSSHPGSFDGVTVGDGNTTYAYLIPEHRQRDFKVTFYKSSKLSDEIGYFTTDVSDDYKLDNVDIGGNICIAHLVDEYWGKEIEVGCVLPIDAAYMKITELKPADDPKPKPTPKPADADEWKSDKEYEGGDYVLYKGKIYKANRRSKGHRPDVYSLSWTIFSDGPKPQPKDDPKPKPVNYPKWKKGEKAYSKGDIVEYKGKIYQAIFYAEPGDVPGAATSQWGNKAPWKEVR